MAGQWLCSQLVGKWTERRKQRFIDQTELSVCQAGLQHAADKTVS